MPSEDHVAAVARALRAPWERFHSALAQAVEDVRSYISSHRGTDHDGDANGRAALGSFAAGRIDPGRFAALVGPEQAVDVGTLSRMARAFESLAALAARANGPLRVDLPPGGDLRAAIARELDTVGRAFGAARVAQLSRTGRYDESAHKGLLDGVPFAAWSAGERGLAPPIVVEADGSDVRAGDLAAFLDGAAKIVLVVRGVSPPAPLARLITPGTYVLQTSDPADVKALAAFAGPGVAAIVGEDAARFVHDPSRGAALADRLKVKHVPDTAPRSALGGCSVFQQTEDLRQLAVLAAACVAAAPVAAPAVVTAPAPDAGVVTSAPAVDPAGRLAAWLLQQAELPGNV